MFDVKGVDIQIEILVLEDFNTIKDRYNLIQTVMQAIFHYYTKNIVYFFTCERFTITYMKNLSCTKPNSI